MGGQEYRAAALTGQRCCLSHRRGFGKFVGVEQGFRERNDGCCTGWMKVVCWIGGVWKGARGCDLVLIPFDGLEGEVVVGRERRVGEWLFCLEGG